MIRKMASLHCVAHQPRPARTRVRPPMTIVRPCIVATITKGLNHSQKRRPSGRLFCFGHESKSSAILRYRPRVHRELVLTLSSLRPLGNSCWKPFTGIALEGICFGFVNKQQIPRSAKQFVQQKIILPAERGMTVSGFYDFSILNMLKEKLTNSSSRI